jgi:hypothetical protein
VAPAAQAQVQAQQQMVPIQLMPYTITPSVAPFVHGMPPVVVTTTTTSSAATTHYGW